MIMVFYKPLTIEYFKHPRLFDCTVSKSKLKNTKHGTGSRTANQSSIFVCASTLNTYLHL